MKKNKKIVLLITLMDLLTGCTKTLENKDGKPVISTVDNK